MASYYPESDIPEHLKDVTDFPKYIYTNPEPLKPIKIKVTP